MSMRSFGQSASALFAFVPPLCGAIMLAQLDRSAAHSTAAGPDLHGKPSRHISSRKLMHVGFGDIACFNGAFNLNRKIKTSSLRTTPSQIMRISQGAASHNPTAGERKVLCARRCRRQQWPDQRHEPGRPKRHVRGSKRQLQQQEANTMAKPAALPTCRMAPRATLIRPNARRNQHRLRAAPKRRPLPGVDAKEA
jgi:hypothetical protein